MFMKRSNRRENGRENGKVQTEKKIDKESCGKETQRSCCFFKLQEMREKGGARKMEIEMEREGRA